MASSKELSFGSLFFPASFWFVFGITKLDPVSGVFPVFNEISTELSVVSVVTSLSGADPGALLDGVVAVCSGIGLPSIKWTFLISKQQLNSKANFLLRVCVIFFFRV